MTRASISETKRMPAEKTKTYSRIEGSLVKEIRLIPASYLDEVRSKTGSNLSSRIFIETSEDYPHGSPVHLDIDIPGRGLFQMDGITEWAGDAAPEAGRGLGILLFQITGSENTSGGGSGSGQTVDENGSAEQEAAWGGAAVDPEKTVLPEASAISDLLESLLDMKATLAPGAPVMVDGESITAIATFALDDGRIKALWICDLPMLIKVGAALSVIPPEMAQANIDSKEIPDNIKENFQEVLNVSASLFNRPDGPHVSLGDLTITPEAVSDAVEQAMSMPSGRMDLTATIPGYGDGAMTLIETDAE